MSRRRNDDEQRGPSEIGQTARLNVPPVRKGPQSADEERDQFAGFAARHAEPWHSEILAVLYGMFWKLNAAIFASQLRQPHLMIGMTAPRVLGFCKNFTDYGAMMQITVRRSLFDGSHRGVAKVWHEDFGVQRLAFDVLLHELVHQYHFEITGTPELKLGGHGKHFTRECNRITADHFVDEDQWEDLGQADVMTTAGFFGPRVKDVSREQTWRVATRSRGRSDKHKPLAKHWPISIRPAGYYGEFVTIGPRQKQPEPKHVPQWAMMFENLIAYYEQGRIGEFVAEARRELRKLQDADCPGCAEAWDAAWDRPVCRLAALQPSGLPEHWLTRLPKLCRPLDGEHDF